MKRFDDVGQRNALPGNHHRPAFHTAQAVDAVLYGVAFQEVVQVEAAGQLGFAAYRHDPGLGLQGMGEFGRIGLAGAEFIEIVVAGDVFETCFHVAGSKAVRTVIGLVRRHRCFGFGAAGQCQQGAGQSGADQLAASAVDCFRGDFGGGYSGVVGHGAFLGFWPVRVFGRPLLPLVENLAGNLQSVIGICTNPVNRCILMILIHTM